MRQGGNAVVTGASSGLGRELARQLVEQRGMTVLVAARRGHLRVSPHFYNNEQDLETLSNALGELL